MLDNPARKRSAAEPQGERDPALKTEIIGGENFAYDELNHTPTIITTNVDQEDNNLEIDQNTSIKPITPQEQQIKADALIVAALMGNSIVKFNRFKNKNYNKTFSAQISAPAFSADSPTNSNVFTKESLKKQRSMHLGTTTTSSTNNNTFISSDNNNNQSRPKFLSDSNLALEKGESAVRSTTNDTEDSSKIEMSFLKDRNSENNQDINNKSISKTFNINTNNANSKTKTIGSKATKCINLALFNFFLIHFLLLLYSKTKKIFVYYQSKI
jgi:hypothetical protein